uniref:Nuclear pore complex protein Nup214 n=1 Tax=Takifugu rubripes TaxID=31033 RepID=A0A674MFT8_TAKRU
MSDDTDSPPEREMKDFEFRQMKKARVFEPAEDLPKERSNLLKVSNKYGLTFVGFVRTFKVYQTQDILNADKSEGNSNEVGTDYIFTTSVQQYLHAFEGITALAEVTGELVLHHLDLSCDELTLSVCGTSAEGGLSLRFYDVRTFINKARVQKLPFASVVPPVPPGTLVLDLKWNPTQATKLAVCMTDGRMQILDVADSVKMVSELPASSGITCVCWSPKGKQVAAGKMNATVSQYTPALEEKKVIPCPHFYTSDEPIKVLDVLWLKTFVFAVVYAAADGSPETPPDLVLISLPKKDEKVETKYLNFSDTVYGSCTERQHHYFLSHVEDWDLVFAASAASIEVSVIARQDDKIWELWILEDASRAELPVTETNDDTLPLGLAIDYTSQTEIHITDEKILPPAPTMLMLSTEGLLCPFALLNFNPGVKQLISPPTTLALEGERLPKPGRQLRGAEIMKVFTQFRPISVEQVADMQVSSFKTMWCHKLKNNLCAGSLAVPPFRSGASIASAHAAFPSLGLTSAAAPTLPASAGPFSVVPTASGPVPPSSSSSSFGFSVTNPLPSSTASAAAPFGSGSLGFSFATKPPSDTPSAQSAFLFSSTIKPSTVAPAATASLPSLQSIATAVSVKSMEKQLQEKKDSDPIMAGILEEIAHFQTELDDLKARSARTDIKVGTTEEMKELRKESEDLHIFTLEIKETTESLYGDISTLNTHLLEGFAGAEEAKTQTEMRSNRNYRQLLYKKPLDPRSEEQLKEIRRLYQYVIFAVDDVNDVLNAEWEKHLEKKKKHKHMIVPGQENLYTTLANNQYIINQQKDRLDHLVKELISLRLYNKRAAQTTTSDTATTSASLDSELESLRKALLESKLDSTPPKTVSKSPMAKISPAKLSQLRNFLSKSQMPPVRSTAPANLSRSAFLSPKYYEDLDEVSSTSSLSQSLEPHPAHLELEEDELQPEVFARPAIPPSLSTPRHPTVVRTPSIQPGFGAIQSTPLTKIQPGPGMVPTNKINLSGAESTALATKTVKHGAPPSERAIPVTISAQQAAATAALRRQMATQKTGRKTYFHLESHLDSLLWFQRSSVHL